MRKIKLLSLLLLFLLAACEPGEETEVSVRTTTDTSVVVTTDTSSTSLTTGTMYLYDPLTNGSYATVSGGTFTSSGYVITEEGGYIAYRTGITTTITVEFDAYGFTGTDDKDKALIVALHDHPNLLPGWSEMYAEGSTHHLIQFRKRAWGMGDISNGAQLKCSTMEGDVEYALSSWGGDSGVGHPLVWGGWNRWALTVSGQAVAVYRDGVRIFSGTHPACHLHGLINVLIGGSPFLSGTHPVYYKDVMISY